MVPPSARCRRCGCEEAGFAVRAWGICRACLRATRAMVTRALPAARDPERCLGCARRLVVAHTCFRCHAALCADCYDPHTYPPDLQDPRACPRALPADVR